MEDYSTFVPNVHFEKIPIKNLVSNQAYQRNLSLPHIRRTVEHFDVRQINPVKVSRRDGINYVVNGQHTIEIVAAVSGSRETPVWCMIYDDLEYMEEANTFANQQKYVKNLLPYEIFNAHLEAQNRKQLLIKALVESYDLKIGPTKGPGVICAVASLEYIFNRYGYNVLDRSLRLCVGVWEGETNSLSATMIKGIAMLAGTYGDELRDDMFKERVGRLSAREISRIAKERRGGSRGYAEAMLMEYNKKLRHPLPIVKLYSKERRRTIDVDEELMAAAQDWLQATPSSGDEEVGPLFQELNDGITAQGSLLQDNEATSPEVCFMADTR